MVRGALVLAIVLTASGCARRSDPAVSQAVRGLAAQRLFECWVTNASRLDDGISGAQEIGAAVVSSCNGEAMQMARVYFPGNPIQQQRFFESSRSDYNARASVVVLQLRAKRVGKPPQ
jgi:hypothetical protein